MIGSTPPGPRMPASGHKWSGFCSGILPGGDCYWLGGGGISNMISCLDFTEIMITQWSGDTTILLKNLQMGNILQQRWRTFLAIENIKNIWESPRIHEEKQ